MYTNRIARLAPLMQVEGLDAIALNPGPSLVYLTGLSFHLMERPVVGIFTPDHRPILILPELEQSKLDASGLDIEAYSYGEDEASRLQAFKLAAAKVGLNDKCVGVEPRRLRVLELRLLETITPAAKYVSGEGVISALRLVKDEVEVKSIRHAVEVAERALQATLSLFLVGMTERELAAELVMQLLRAGSESEFPFSPIVASGPNSAIPHATPTDRAIQAGDLLIMDWGAKIDGYVSDITRTFAIGDIDPEFAQIYRIVTQANAAGRDAIRPEITCGEIDHAAREIIEAAKFGDYFLHRTGHGIGMEGHEPPYIQAGSDQRLVPGMTFTVEPGIYLPDRGGVRIEDDMLVTEDGGVSLTTYPRELEVIP